MLSSRIQLFQQAGHASCPSACISIFVPVGICISSPSPSPSAPPLSRTAADRLDAVSRVLLNLGSRPVAQSGVVVRARPPDRLARRPQPRPYDGHLARPRTALLLSLWSLCSGSLDLRPARHHIISPSLSLPRPPFPSRPAPRPLRISQPSPPGAPDCIPSLLLPSHDPVASSPTTRCSSLLTSYGSAGCVPAASRLVPSFRPFLAPQAPCPDLPHLSVLSRLPSLRSSPPLLFLMGNGRSPSSYLLLLS